MADKKKPGNGISGRRVSRPTKTPRGKPDPGGFKSKGFKSEGFTGRAPEKKPRPGQSPPSTREKERKGGPPSKRPSVSTGKKKVLPKFGQWHWGDIDPPKRPRKPFPKQNPKKPMKPGKKKTRKK